MQKVKQPQTLWLKDLWLFFHFLTVKDGILTSHAASVNEKEKCCPEIFRKSLKKL